MNTAQDILSYAKTHDIKLVAQDGQIKIDAPKAALTDEFLEAAKVHKQEIITALSQERWNPELLSHINTACSDLDISPDQFLRVLTNEGKQRIINGDLSGNELREYAINVDACIKADVLKFYLDTIH